MARVAPGMDSPMTVRSLGDLTSPRDFGQPTPPAPAGEVLRDTSDQSSGSMMGDKGGARIQLLKRFDQRIALLALLTIAFVVWLVLLVIAPFGFLNDPVIGTLSITVFFVLFKTVASRHMDLNSIRSLRTVFTVGLAVVLMHAAVAVFAVSRGRVASSGGGAGLPLETVRVVLLYVLLLTVLVVGLWIARLRRRVQTIDDEMREVNVKYSMMQHMMSRFGDEEDEEPSSDLEGDERETLIVPPVPEPIRAEARYKPELCLPEAMHGVAFNRDLALKIAARMRKKAYGLPHFYDDIRKAFPELELYCATLAPAAGGNGAGSDADDAPAGAAPNAVTSGLTSDAEYRRTIGAMFAVYWLMRIGIDGERGFSFGVDENWVPREVPATPSNKTDSALAALNTAGGANAADDKAEELKRAEITKRLSFYENQDWQRLQQLLADGGLIEVDDHGAVTTNVERTVAMLALTAFHDIMKVEALLPAVAAEHTPYLGFKAGDVINDHDLALGYVLDFHAGNLPSFEAMNADDQRTIRFTQSKMQFNHGWLVQGEAPPAPLFAKFKEVMLEGGVAPSDVAFYFVHWLTDLAGAEPSPLGGGEKFVLKFPHAVLDSFIRSFAVLNDLAVATETEVMERYLLRTWGEGAGQGHPPPTDEDGVALMRLVLQAQTPEKQQAVMRAYRALPRDDLAVLREEMARTGIANQTFVAAPASKGGVSGPAFLVYYSPAFLRTLAPANALEALRLLAEVYRRARSLWPLRPTAGSHHAVTIRIDQLKELKLGDILSAFSQGESWILCRKNDNEAVVERHTLEYLAEQQQQQQAEAEAGAAAGKGAAAGGVPVKMHAVLKFWRCDKEGGASRQSSVARSKRSASSGGKGADAMSAAGSQRSGVTSISEEPLSMVPGGLPAAAQLQSQLGMKC